MSEYSVNTETSTAGLPRNARLLQRDATRRQLVDAGLRVVAARGLAGATTAAIAEASGKAHGTVFVHFRNRDDLVDALVQELGRAISQRLAELADDGAPSDAGPGVAEVLDAHLAALAEFEALVSCVLRESATLPPAARARVFALQSGVAWRLRHALARDVARGRARAIEPLTLANVWIALVNHYLIHRDLFAPGASVVATRGAELKAQLLSLLAP